MTIGPFISHVNLNITGHIVAEVPYPIPLDPGPDLVPEEVLGGYWVVDAGPNVAGSVDFTGLYAAPMLPACTENCSYTAAVLVCWFMTSGACCSLIECGSVL